NSPGNPRASSEPQFFRESAVYSCSTDCPEIVRKRALRSAAPLFLFFPSAMKETRKSVHRDRARRNELTEKNTNRKATATESAISQYATSRVHARNAELSQPNARIPNSA